MPDFDDNYWGYVVEDCPALQGVGRLYKYWKNIFTSEVQFYLCREDHVVPQLAKEVWHRLTAPSRDEDEKVKMMRLAFEKDPPSMDGCLIGPRAPTAAAAAAAAAESEEKPKGSAMEEGLAAIAASSLLRPRRRTHFMGSWATLGGATTRSRWQR